MSEQSQPEITVYLTSTCPYCSMAKNLLNGKGLTYNEINVGGDRALWDAMQEKCGRNTVPQVFIGDHHVGGFDDLSAADRSGELDKILAGNV
ncbi:glutaredoxin 3 [Hydrogenovibrio kuenenii]|uniref:glutaredoxin 3 n=1 Tax=Hydrogenovibrio kuenenii TaxID=63658 RepID=UPI000466693B|nr:glutaredoxin 3 [Hydrogenovibrio kuenenii]